jgi:hypothetical protein
MEAMEAMEGIGELVAAAAGLAQTELARVVRGVMVLLA